VILDFFLRKSNNHLETHWLFMKPGGSLRFWKIIGTNGWFSLIPDFANTWSWQFFDFDFFLNFVFQISGT